jgi:membrane peptidoglycan carboxypeptidase
MSDTQSHHGSRHNNHNAYRHVLRRRRLERAGHSFRGRLRITILAIFAIFSMAFVSSIGETYSYYQHQLPLIDSIAHNSLFQTTRIYDRNGKLLSELYDHNGDRGRRIYVNYKNISPFIVNATIAAEDHTFWTNNGVDILSIMRAAIANIKHSGIVEGGSTITQQLVKNEFFAGQPRILPVKSQEAVLAIALTKRYPKWKIMEMYLNTVYYGDTNYGIEAAAEDYFGLQPQCTSIGCTPAVAHLDLAQSSLLAGLPQSPSIYNPLLYKNEALARQQEILHSMVELGMISKQQQQAAHQEMENFIFHSYSATHKIQAPHFVNYVIDQLERLIGDQALENGGYNIYTTLDLDLEKKVEQIVYKHLYQPQQGYYGPLYRTNNVNNGAAVVIDPTTGEILAMDGSASTDPRLLSPQMQSDYNTAVSPRQPGSSFKPFVYATAFEMGWYPAMIIPDHKTYYPDGNHKPPYTPQNYDDTFHTGYPMTARTAIANSFNIPAVTTLEYAGIPNVLNMVERLGLTEFAKRPLSSLGPSMALGSIEVSPLHMTAAYATFANRGVRVPSVAILKVADSQGRPIYTFDPSHIHGTRVIREDIAFLISSMLSDKTARYREFSPGNPLEVDRPAAAKTGTTDSFRDNWTIGYTPHLAVGVWVGNSDNSIMRNVIGITGAGPIWHDIMEYASHHYNFPPDDFIPPNNVHKSPVSALSGLLPHPGEPTVNDWFIDGTMPTIQGPETVSILPMCQDDSGFCQVINHTEQVVQNQSQNNWPSDNWPQVNWPQDDLDQNNWPQVNWPQNNQDQNNWPQVNWPQNNQDQNNWPQNSQPQDNSGRSNSPDQSEHHSHYHHHHRSHHHD